MRDLHQEADLVCLRTGDQVKDGAGEDHDIGLRLAGRIVFWLDINRDLLNNAARRENRFQPLHEQNESADVRVVLAHFLDQFPVDEFVLVKVKEARELGTLVASPFLPRDFCELHGGRDESRRHIRYYRLRMSWGYLEDAGGYKGHADRICVPLTEAELCSLMAEANEKRIPVTIAGGGSGLTGGRVPQGGWLISMEKFRRLEVGDGMATVGAGVTLHDLHAAAKAHGQFYPPDPTETMAFLGGTVACNSSGSRSFLYGATRRWINRLRVVMMDGTVKDVRRGEAIDFAVPEIPQPATKKHSAGYLLKPGMDWVDLFTGAEGTLGVVVEAEVKLLPTPKELLNGIVFFPSDETCFAALDAWRSVVGLRMLEYVDWAALKMIGTKFPEIPAAARGALIIEQIVEGDEVEAWADRLEKAQGMGDLSWFGTTDADRERFRKFRHALPETVLAISERNGFMKMGSDFSVPVERNREMIAYYRERMEQIMPGEYCIFGHLGDAHAHVNMTPSTQERFDAGAAVLTEFAKKAVELGGSVAAEHGLGKRKAKFLPLQYTAEQIEAMKAVKRRFDPHWLLGQGTLFASEAGL